MKHRAEFAWIFNETSLKKKSLTKFLSALKKLSSYFKIEDFLLFIENWLRLISNNSTRIIVPFSLTWKKSKKKVHGSLFNLCQVAFPFYFYFAVGVAVMNEKSFLLYFLLKFLHWTLIYLIHVSSLSIVFFFLEATFTDNGFCNEKKEALSSTDSSIKKQKMRKCMFVSIYFEENNKKFTPK